MLYLKASEQIEDLLTFMGASGAALEIMNLKVYKDFRNKANRITNCETANIDKTVSASGQTLEAIAYLKKRGAFETLPAPLRSRRPAGAKPGPFLKSWPGWSALR
ncbi:MAG: DNA-binding protein WhiA [Ruthenibacterium lactatiformans]